MTSDIIIKCQTVAHPHVMDARSCYYSRRLILPLRAKTNLVITDISFGLLHETSWNKRKYITGRMAVYLGRKRTVVEPANDVDEDVDGR